MIDIVAVKDIPVSILYVIEYYIIICSFCIRMAIEVIFVWLPVNINHHT